MRKFLPLAKRGVTAWEAFWFEPIPGSVFALLRITIGFVGFVGVIGLMPVSMFWPLDGLVPVSGEGEYLRAAATALGLGSLAGWVMFATLAVAFACMTIGYMTGAAIATCFIGSIVQSHWNSLPLGGGHEVLIVVLFCLIWADCSGWPSVDARREPNGSASQDGQSSWPLRLIRIQVAFIYFNSAFWKLLGPTWRDGSTIHYVLNLNTHRRFELTLLPPLDVLTTLATYGTLFWELTFPFMLLNRWTRRVALISGVLLHVGLWATLEIGTFSWIMLATYVAFLDPSTASRVVLRLSRFRSARVKLAPKNA